MSDDAFQQQLAEAAHIHPAMVDQRLVEMAGAVARAFGPAAAADLVQWAIAERLADTTPAPKRRRRWW